MWALAKKEVRKRLVLSPDSYDGELGKTEFARLVLDCCQQVADKHWKTVVNVNRSEVLKYIQ